MAALGNVLALTGARVLEQSPTGEVKCLVIELPTSVDDTDTFTLDLTRYGCTRPIAIFGNAHTTDGQVVVTEAPTTAVATNTITVTVGGSSDNQARSFVLWAR